MREPTWSWNRLIWELSVVGALAALVVALYRTVTRLWWTWDDAYLLHIAITRSAHEHFFEPSLWRSLPQRLFMPILTASYDAALSAFGFDARPFYVVHLVELVLLAIMLAVIANRHHWQTEFQSALRQSNEARAFFDLGPDDLLAYPTIPPAAIAELRWLKEEWVHRPRGAGWFYDDIFVCEGMSDAKRTFAWSET